MKLSENVLNETFKECYSELLARPYEIDVKEHYAKIIKTYGEKLFDLLPSNIHKYFNAPEWTWNRNLDSGQYFQAAEIERLLYVIGSMSDGNIKDLVCSQDIGTEVRINRNDPENRKRWNKYHGVFLENQKLKNRVKELENEINVFRKECGQNPKYL